MRTLALATLLTLTTLGFFLLGNAVTHAADINKDRIGMAGCASYAMTSQR